MARNEKVSERIEACVSDIGADERDVYRAIAEYAAELGYKPSRVKNTRGVTVAYAFAKRGRRLCKISPPLLPPSKGKDLYQTGKTILALSFYATPSYSEVFREGVRQEYESLKGNYTGCYGCETCSGRYTYTYPDGKSAVCCGTAKLIELPPVGAEHLDEIRAMMRTQDDFWQAENSRAG